MTRCSNEYVLLFLGLWNVLFSHLKCHYDMYYSFLIFSCRTTYLKIDLWSLDNNSEYILLLQVLLKYKIASVNKPPFTYLFFYILLSLSLVSLFTKYVFYPKVFHFIFISLLPNSNKFILHLFLGSPFKGRFSAHSSSAFMVKPSQNIGYALQWKVST